MSLSIEDFVTLFESRGSRMYGAEAVSLEQFAAILAACREPSSAAAQ